MEIKKQKTYEGWKNESTFRAYCYLSDTPKVNLNEVTELLVSDGWVLKSIDFNSIFERIYKDI